MSLLGASTYRPAGAVPLAGIATLAVLAGGAAAAAVFVGSEESAAGAVLALLSGWSFVAAGIVAWRRRPDDRTGLLLVVTGLWLLARVLAHAGEPVPHTIGIALAGGAFAAFGHLLLAFPDGRLRSRLERGLVLAAYVVALPVQVLMLVFMRYEDGRNRLFLIDDDGLHAAVMYGQHAAGVVIALAIVWVLAGRWRQAASPMRRALAPVFVTGAAASVLVATSLGASAVSGSLGAPLEFAALVMLALVPAAFLLGLVRARLARAAVGDLVVALGETAAPGRLRDALARALGDPSLELAYWIPESGSWADVEGRPVELPGEGAAQATTLVEHRGRRVAALVHDPSLGDDPPLVEAVCAAAGLALENERLQAELRARLEDLRASRARIVQAGDSERRRLERNLHDGAQQRLVSLSLILGLIESKLPGDAPSAKELAVGAHEELGLALEELRELARGLHPAILGRGLKFALAAVAERSPVPVELHVDSAERPPEPVEAAAYYVVSEALTNVARYAEAGRATLRVTREDGWLRVEVGDDGVGGARISEGSGLQGLRDRVEAIGGRLDVDSPLGWGTRIVARLPL